MSVGKTEYVGTGSLTLTAPASGSARESSAYDNSSNGDMEVHVHVKFTSGTVSGNQQIALYVGASYDGTAWEDTLTGADAEYTLLSPTALRLAAVIPTPTSSREYEALIPIAYLFGGWLPEKFNLVLMNDGGGTLTNLSVTYQRLRPMSV